MHLLEDDRRHENLLEDSWTGRTDAGLPSLHLSNDMDDLRPQAPAGVGMSGLGKNPPRLAPARARGTGSTISVDFTGSAPATWARRR